MNPNGMHGSALHRAIVAELVSAGASAGGLRQATEDAVGCDPVGLPRIIPDAFCFNHNERRAFFYEVCISHGVSRKRLAAVLEWKRWFEGHGWAFRLMMFARDRKGVGILPEDGGFDEETMHAYWHLLRGTQ